MKILVTAFDPFGGDSQNSSLMALEKLPLETDCVTINKLVIPTVYEKSANAAWSAATECGADAVVALGQAGGRRAVTVEVIAINYACAKLGDNEGNVIYGERLSADGENAIFATLPVKEMVVAANKKGFDAELSVSAGGFVCNSLLYRLLEKAKLENRQIPIGFVHLPYATSQNKDGYSMTVEDMAECVIEMIKVIANKNGRNE